MLLCATLIAAAITTAALAMADYWYTACRNPDNTWQICNVRGDGQCHSALHQQLHNPRNTRLMNRSFAMALTGAVVFTGVALASPAHADPGDAYLAELQRRGVDYSMPDAAIKLGKATCLALQQGNSVMAVINTIEDQGFTGHDTGIILGAAANTFCPDQLSTVEGFIANHGG
jgi:Protein of unknown function (DUF732)